MASPSQTPHGMQSRSALASDYPSLAPHVADAGVVAPDQSTQQSSKAANTIPHPEYTGLQSSPTIDYPCNPEQFEADIDQDPQAHFLSPVRMYEAWDDSDDDDDGDDVIDWDAGIVDYGLFYEDHKHAKELNAPLPSKWDAWLADQAQTFKRTLQRTQAQAIEPEFLSRTPSGDSLPGLTPDSSPHLLDNLEYDSGSETDASAPCLKIIVTPPPPPEGLDSAVDDLDDDLPLSFFVERGRAQRRAIEQARSKVRLTRPGMRGGHTLSGKRHAWRRPSWELWAIDESSHKEEESVEE